MMLPYECPWCGQLYTEPILLFLHMRRHKRPHKVAVKRVVE